MENENFPQFHRVGVLVNDVKLRRCGALKDCALEARHPSGTKIFLFFQRRRSDDGANGWNQTSAALVIPVLFESPA